MNYSEILTQIFEVCIIPLLGVLTTYLVKFIQTKRDQIITTSENDLEKKYAQMLADTITTCVIATNQTYVDALKDKEKFTKKAQEEAFNMTCDAVKNILSDEAKIYLTNMYGDLNVYITKQIEAAVKENKK